MLRVALSSSETTGTCRYKESSLCSQCSCHVAPAHPKLTALAAVLTKAVMLSKGKRTGERVRESQTVPPGEPGTPWVHPALGRSTRSSRMTF